MGVVAPNGIGVERFWETILACESGIGPITLFDASGFQSQIAGEVKNFNLTDFLQPRTHVKRLARHTQLALAAAKLAVDDAKLDSAHPVTDSDFPVFMGVSSSSLDVVAHGMKRFYDSGPTRVPTHIVSAGMPQQAATVVSEEIELTTNGHTISSACASGLDAVSLAMNRIRGGSTDIALAGGADAPISPTFFAFLDRAGLSSRRNDNPEQASAPFDKDCDTGVISEGAAVFVLENLQHALARGAPIYLELSGAGSHANLEPSRLLSGLPRAMELALANASKRGEALDYICAHGPGHPTIDRLEVQILKEFFGEHIHQIAVSSIKGVTGNPLAATGPMQIVACACAIRDNLIPPTANFRVAHDDCELDFVVEHPRPARIDSALINVHAIGGNNSCMVVERVPDVWT